MMLCPISGLARVHRTRAANCRLSMTKQKWMILVTATVAFIWVGLIVVLKTIQNNLNRGHDQPIQQISIGPQDDWNAPAFSFVDQDGKKVTNQDLRGHVWIADFFFTQCTSACPILTSKLLLLQKQLKSPGIRFISFSVDPEHDSPEALKKYAQLWEGDESRWRLLSTDPNGLAAVASAMKVDVARVDDKDNPIRHSSLFMLVDSQGKVRGIYDSIDNDALNQLVEEAKSLTGESVQASAVATGTGSTAIARGQVLFGSAFYGVLIGNALMLFSFCLALFAWVPARWALAVTAMFGLVLSPGMYWTNSTLWPSGS